MSGTQAERSAMAGERESGEGSPQDRERRFHEQMRQMREQLQQLQRHARAEHQQAREQRQHLLRDHQERMQEIHGSARGGRGMRDRQRTALSREAVVRAALGIVDRDGLDAFSMRKLGAELGVDPMAVYYYFPNKAAVLDGIADAVYAEIAPPADTDAPWDARLRQMMHSYRDALRAHPNALPVLSTHPPSTPTMLRQEEAALAMLCGVGFPPVEAFYALTNLGSYVVGIVLAEVGVQPGGVPDPNEADVMAQIERMSPEAYPTLMAIFRDGPTFEQARQFDAAFEMGLDFFIAGIAARLARLRG